ncbi:MAG: triose-phosphate isomerase family protein [Blautia sp.]|nr:triose-phosphate isomerase family protein [Blautia sp.]
MKHIYLNLKRFDIPSEFGGVNRIAPVDQWGKYIVENIQDELDAYDSSRVDFTVFFPELHLLDAMRSCKEGSSLKIGSQGVYRQDTLIGGNFGAFTCGRTANAMKAAGCKAVLIGHCEERKDKLEIMQAAGTGDTDAVNRILNQEVKTAIAAGLEVLYCIGENAEEQGRWQEVLEKQIRIGLEGVNLSKVTIAYEPIWAIGPGKIPPDAPYIQKIAAYIKKISGGLDVVYGGGLKTDNARMLASIQEIDGGLIALTRFSGEIGYYPDEYLEIIRTYMEKL